MNLKPGSESATTALHKCLGRRYKSSITYFHSGASQVDVPNHPIAIYFYNPDLKPQRIRPILRYWTRGNALTVGMGFNFQVLQDKL
jgi:hypothetical protein